MQATPVQALLLLAAAVAMATAQQPCCTPFQWEGLVSSHFTPNSIFRESYAEVSYDFNNKLIAANETLIGSSTTSRQRVLFNGRTLTVYIVEARRRECKILAVEKGMDPPCVPSFFRGEGTYHFGAASEQLSYNAFRGLVGQLEYVVTTTSKLCVPITQMAFNNKFREVTAYVNLSSGIRSRAVFNVPAECRRAEEQQLEPKKVTIQQLRAMTPSIRGLFSPL